MQNQETHELPQAYEIQASNDAETEESLNKKEDRRAELTLKWEKKLESRRIDAEERKAKKNKDVNTNENAAKFMKHFHTHKPALVSKVDESVAKRESDQISGDDLQTLLNVESRKVQGFQQDVANAALYLPPYDLRQAALAITEMTEYIEQARTRGAPRKKFSFRSKKAATKQSSNNLDTKTKLLGSTQAGTLATQPAGSEIGSEATPDTNKPTERAVASQEAMEALAAIKLETQESEVVYDSNRIAPLIKIDGEVTSIVVGGASSSEQLERNQFVRFTDINGCFIYLLGTVGSLRLINLRDCTVVATAVDGSCFVENCHNCNVHVASRQVRIHDTTNTRFLLSVLSRPIIEDCKELGFGPWILKREGLMQQREEAGLAKGSTNETWKQVDDFKWLRKQQSPNWRLLDPEECSEACKAISSSYFDI